MDSIYIYELRGLAKNLVLYGRWMLDALSESNVDFGSWELEEFEVISRRLREVANDITEYVSSCMEKIEEEEWGVIK